MTLCIIPARLQSSRLPHKLLLEVEGKSVLQRTFECALTCLQQETIQSLFVATDSEQIAQHVQGFGGEVLWTSPLCQNGTERIVDALQREPRLQNYSVILNLQGDHPCTEPATLTRLAELLKEDLQAEVATLVRPIRSWEDFKAPHIVKCAMTEQGRALFFSRSPIPYQKNERAIPKAWQHLGLYAYRPCFLQKMSQWKKTPLQEMEDLEPLQFLEKGTTIAVAAVEDPALSVDVFADLEKLRAFLLAENAECD